MRGPGGSHRLLTLLLGGVLLLVGIVGVGYPMWWNHRSATTGQSLLASADSAILASSASCPKTVASASQPGKSPGILEVPSLNLVAPVLDGLSDKVLNVAAGHVTGAPWPGAAGEAMVEAHDVSYFAQLGHIKAGATVIWITPCERAQFKVLKTSVTTPGVIVSPPANNAGLALVTCYPTNALFWTPKRFLVTTQLVSAKLGPQTLPRLTGGAPKIGLPIPAALNAKGLALSQNQLILGVMQFSGHPHVAWTEGAAPITVEADALTIFFGAEKTIQAQNASWWQSIAPGVPMPSSWPTFGPGAANITIAVNGTTPASVTIASPSASVTVTVQNNVMHLTRIS
ncbi:MAG TPA: class D sortase [Acidimicrobiales bacterium]